jgi:hypothetical protein
MIPILELWQKNFFQQINKQVLLNKLLDPLPCVPKNVLHGVQKMSLPKKKKKKKRRTKQSMQHCQPDLTAYNTKIDSQLSSDISHRHHRLFTLFATEKYGRSRK